MNRSVLQRATQWLLTLGSAFLVLRIIDLRAIPYIIASANIPHLILAILIAVAHFFVGAWRWQNLMFLYGAIGVPYTKLCSLYIASFFVSSILPGTITGDGLRVYGIRNDVGGVTTALVIVLLERLLGVILLVIIGLIAWTLIPIHPLLQLVLPRVEYVLILFAVAAGLVGFGAIFWRPLVMRVYAWLGKFFGIIVQLPDLIFAKPFIAAKVFFGSLTYQLLSVLIVFEALCSTGVPISLQVFLTVVPIVTVLLILPISVQGMGVRESLYLVFLVPYGLKSEPIIAGLALTYVIGVPFILWGWFLFNRMYRNQSDDYHSPGVFNSHDTLQ